MSKENSIKEAQAFLAEIKAMELETCKNKLRARMNCAQCCSYYKTEKCLQPKKAFNGHQIDY